MTTRRGRFEVWAFRCDKPTALESVHAEFVEARAYAELLAKEFGERFIIADKSLTADDAGCSPALAEACRVWRSWP